MSDLLDAHKSKTYPGYMVYVNSNYKTSTIYGEKVIVSPSLVVCYNASASFSSTKKSNLFVALDFDEMSHGAIGNALTLVSTTGMYLGMMSIHMSVQLESVAPVQHLAVALRELKVHILQSTS